MRARHCRLSVFLLALAVAVSAGPAVSAKETLAADTPRPAWRLVSTPAAGGSGLPVTSQESRPSRGGGFTVAM